MRDIEYRIWIPDAKHTTEFMFYQETQYLASFIRRVHMAYGVKDHASYMPFAIEERLMRYTGFKDKNDRKIFERDILKVTDEDGHTHYTDRNNQKHLVSDGGIGEVKFEYGMWYVDGQPSNGLFDLVKINSCLVEVIGNSYQYITKDQEK